MKVSFLGGSHACMTEPSRYARYGYAGKQEERCMCVTQPMDGYRRRADILQWRASTLFAVELYTLPLTNIGSAGEGSSRARKAA